MHSLIVHLSSASSWPSSELDSPTPQVPTVGAWWERRKDRGALQSLLWSEAEVSWRSCDAFWTGWALWGIGLSIVSLLLFTIVTAQWLLRADWLSVSFITFKNPLQRHPRAHCSQCPLLAPGSPGGITLAMHSGKGVHKKMEKQGKRLSPHFIFHTVFYHISSYRHSF